MRRITAVVLLPFLTATAVEATPTDTAPLITTTSVPSSYNGCGTTITGSFCTPFDSTAPYNPIAVLKWRWENVAEDFSFRVQVIQWATIEPRNDRWDIVVEDVKIVANEVKAMKALEAAIATLTRQGSTPKPK